MEKELTIKPLQFVLNEKYRWLFHVIFWIVMYLDEFLSFVGITEPYENYMDFFEEISVDMAMVYINLYLLIPYFLMKGKTFWYGFFTLLTVIMVAFFNYWSCCFEYEFDFSFLFGTMSATIGLLGTAVGFKIFKNYIGNQDKINQLKNDNLQTELAYLKEQINPHFLFNALNGIYVQSRKRPAEVPESILLLSDLLRYQLYDCSHEKVSLKGEIKYIKDYLELEKSRKTDAKIDFQIHGNPNDRMVAPFLFIPFIENAFKHGVSLDETPFINIELHIEDEQIRFNVLNSKPLKPTQNLSGGIGLPNIKRRLSLLYPETHELKITDEGTTYQVNLSLSDKK